MPWVPPRTLRRPLRPPTRLPPREAAHRAFPTVGVHDLYEMDRNHMQV